jgi:hypothetical protein
MAKDENAPYELLVQARRTSFRSDHLAERRERELDGVPYIARRNILIVMTVDVACTRHLLPRDRRMAGFDALGYAARSFRNNLQATRHRIDRARVVLEFRPVESFDKAERQIDVMLNIEKRGACRIRTHRSRRLPPAGYEA